jgi:hypothetical protein
MKPVLLSATVVLGAVACISEDSPTQPGCTRGVLRCPTGSPAIGAVIGGKFFVIVAGERRSYDYIPRTNVWRRRAAPKWAHRYPRSLNGPNKNARERLCDRKPGNLTQIRRFEAFLPSSAPANKQYLSGITFPVGSDA